MIVEIIGVTVAVYSVYQIYRFYNVKFKFPWFCFSYYLFLVLLKWLCSDNDIDTFMGYVTFVDLDANTVTTDISGKKYFEGDVKKFTMNNDIIK
jgi:hypothetical protein